MKYEFGEIELGGMILPVEGYAIIEHDPREKRRHMPTIVLQGFEPGTTCDAAELVLDRSPLTLFMSMNFELRRWLYDPAGRHFSRMCDQWDAERPHRRQAAYADAIAASVAGA